MKKLKRKLQDFKIKPKFFVLLFVCFLAIGYSAIQVAIYMAGSVGIIVNQDDNSNIYISFASVNTNYVYTNHLSMEDFSLRPGQKSFVFKTSLLDANDNNISYRIMNKSRNYDMENVHIICSESSNYTFTDINADDNDGNLDAQSYRDGNISVVFDNSADEEISCVLMYDLKERTELASVVEMDETPLLTYDASEVGYEKSGYGTIHTVEDALNYLYDVLG